MKKGNWGMARIFVPAFCLALSMSLCLDAAATEIYTWTDENGVVHFSSTEPTSTPSETIEIEASRGGVSYSQPVAASEMDAENAGQEPLPTAAEQKRQEIAQARMQQQEERAAITELCEYHRQQLVEMEPARRVYYTNEEGQRVRMDDDERVALIEESNSYVAENCQ
jgi:hypothetical protein